MSCYESNDWGMPDALIEFQDREARLDEWCPRYNPDDAAPTNLQMMSAAMRELLAEEDLDARAAHILQQMKVIYGDDS